MTEQPNFPRRETGVQPEAKSVFSDVMSQAVAGPAAAVNEMFESLENLAEVTAEGITGTDIPKDQRAETPGAAGLVKEGAEQVLEATGDPETTAGGITRGITQFLTGFLGANKVFKAAKGAKQVPTLLRSMGAGAVADATSFDPHEERLSNLVQEYPVLQNPVNEYLAADPGDSEAEGRFKNALEGLALGPPAEGLFHAVRAIRGAKSVKKGSQSATGAEEQVQEAVEKATDPENATSAARAAEEETKTLQDILADTDLRDPDQGIDFNFDTWKSDEDIRETVNAVSLAISDNIDKAKGGVQTLRETERLAEILGEKPAKLMEQLAADAGEASNLGARIVAGKKLLQGLAKDVHGLATRLRLDPENATPKDEKLLMERLGLMQQLQTNLKAAQTGAARATSAGRIETGGNTDALVEAILGTGGDPAAIAKISRGVSKGWARHNEYLINSMLSSPKTHIVNATSNFAQLFVLPTEDLMSAAVRLNRTDAMAVGQYFMGLGQHLTDALKYGAAAMRQERNILDPTHMVYDAPIGMIPGKVGKAVRMPSRFLLSSDEFFKQISYRAQVRALAYKEGVQKGLKGQELKDFMSDYFEKSFDENGLGVNKEALRRSKEVTFTTDLEHGVGKSIQGLVNKHPALRMIAPFVRTPTNLFRYAWQRTPLVGALQKDMREMITGPHATVESRSIAMARQMTGSALTGTAVMLAMDGNITGRGPADPELRSQLYDTGWRPYSFVKTDPETGKKTYYQFHRGDPFGMFFGIVADMAEIGGQMAEKDYSELAFALGTSVSRNLTSKTYLQGVVDFLDAIAGGEEWKVERFLQQRAGAYVPNFIRDIRKADDPYLREMETVMDGIVNKIPGWSKTLQPKRNLFGEKIAYPKGYNQSIWNPFIVQSNEISNVVKDEIAKLGRVISLPREKVGPNQNIDLHGYKSDKGQDAYDRFVELHGKVRLGRYTMLQRMAIEIERMNKQDVPALPPEAEYDQPRAKRLSKIVQKYRKAAWQKTLEEFPQLKLAIRKANLENEAVQRYGTDFLEQIKQ